MTARTTPTHPTPATPARLTAAAIALIAAAPALAAIINVPADQPTIQAAIDASAAGDEIVIAPGTYAPFTIASDELLIRSSDGPDVTIIDAVGTGGPAILSQGGPEVTFQGLTIANGTGSGGVGFTLGNPTLTFIDCVFSNNSPLAVGVTTNHDFTFVACSFIGNSGGNGGALRPGNGDFTVTDCHFEGNSATQTGGAIYLGGGGDIQITGCTFTGNTAPTGGAVASFHDFNAPGEVFDSCVFEGNTATGEGGGGAIATADFIPITNCQFTANIAEAGPGGAVRSSAPGPAMITGSAFDQNQATDGGAVSIGDGDTLTACTFTANTATNVGGAVFAAAGQATITNCEFSMNSADASGGGVYVPDLVIVELSDSTLCLNTPDQFDYVGALLATNVFGCDVKCPGDDPASGACCINGSCGSIEEDACLAFGGTFIGEGIHCEVVDCMPACETDTNGDGVINSTDLNNILSAFGESCP